MHFDIENSLRFNDPHNGFMVNGYGDSTEGSGQGTSSGNEKTGNGVSYGHFLSQQSINKFLANFE
jgi:hypothetical protein